MPLRVLFVCALLLAPVVSRPVFAARLKDLVEVRGHRPNHLVGLGVVVGLAGTGDDVSSFLAKRPLATLMNQLGTALDPADIKAKNAAMVMVTAELPAFARTGVDFDVTVSSVGTAKSLEGGTLIATALKGIDRQTYGVAQGQLTVGGFQVTSGFSGSYARKNHVTVARIPNGGIVEREVPQTMPKDWLVLQVKEPDFTTASRIAKAIDGALGQDQSVVRDPGMVAVRIGDKWKDRVVDLIAKVESLEATPDTPARVVIDEKTGTVVVGAHVTLEPVAIAYGGLSVEVRERFGVSQPSAFGQGETVQVPDTRIEVTEEPGKVQILGSAASVGDVANALNALGVKPRDLIPILQALRAAGALRAEIEVL